MNLAQRVLKAVSKHKAAQKGRQAQLPKPVQPVHDAEAGIEGLNAAREEKMPSDLSREERLDRLTAALSKFVDDEPEQRGEGEETVWDVS